MDFFKKRNLPIIRRRAAYRALFARDANGELSPQARRVLADLRKFCRADAPTFTRGEPDTSALLEGRREVWNRIATAIFMTDEEFARLTETREDEQEAQNDFGQF